VAHPSFLPDRYECGTPNTPGIASLLGGLTFIAREGLSVIVERKQALRRKLLEGLCSVDGVIVYGHEGKGPRAYLPIVAFNIEGKLPSEAGYELNKRSIFVRVGLHCSPVAHQTIGTFPKGTLRASPGYFTGEDDLNTFVEAVREIAKK
jgi:selenocysteine lyase/cysteine desulfurase